MLGIAGGRGRRTRETTKITEDRTEAQTGTYEGGGVVAKPSYRLRPHGGPRRQTVCNNDPRVIGAASAYGKG